MKKPAYLLLIAAAALVLGNYAISNAEAETVFTPLPSPLVLSVSEDQAAFIFDEYIQEASKKSFNSDLAESILAFANKYMGSVYMAGGNTPSGFDCSGFTSFVYSNFGIDVPHGSANQAFVGHEITEKEARKGDLLIFTGTNLSVREPGHVGIIISEQDEPIKFIHSSSNGGVKISEVPNTRYSERLLQIRRVL